MAHTPPPEFQPHKNASLPDATSPSQSSALPSEARAAPRDVFRRRQKLNASSLQSRNEAPQRPALGSYLAKLVIGNRSAHGLVASG